MAASALGFKDGKVEMSDEQLAHAHSLEKTLRQQLNQ